MSIEWTWEGNDEMAPASGRGWVVLDGDEIHRVIAIHYGDESEFVAKRAKASKRTNR
ncbi:MAG TPA: hypothetical protein VMF69_24695 [Gemmataceae bacterium]|nr:hypothetical protein [Gemmataceae bacterium]